MISLKKLKLLQCSYGHAIAIWAFGHPPCDYNIVATHMISIGVFPCQLPTSKVCGESGRKGHKLFP